MFIGGPGDGFGGGDWNGNGYYDSFDGYMDYSLSSGDGNYDSDYDSDYDWNEDSYGGSYYGGSTSYSRDARSINKSKISKEKEPQKDALSNAENWDLIFRCIAAIVLCAIAFVITFASGSATFGVVALIAAGIGGYRLLRKKKK